MQVERQRLAKPGLSCFKLASPVLASVVQVAFNPEMGDAVARRALVLEWAQIMAAMC